MKKKILFWITNDFTEFCVAYNLQNNSNYELYAIIDVPSNTQKFFEKQTLVKFEKVWFFHDHIKKEFVPNVNYLQSIEEKYDIILWKLSINERIFYRFYNFHNFGKQEIQSIMEQSCKLFENILENVKPNYLISKTPGFFHLEILKNMCEKTEIPVLIQFVPKLGYKLMISGDPRSINSKHEVLDSEIKNRTFEELQNYLKNSRTKEQIKDYLDSQGKKNGLITAAIKFLFSKNNSIKNRYTYYGRKKFNVILFMLKLVFRDRSRKNFIDSNFEKKPVKHCPFVYFPMGVDLERNILIGAPYFTNQIEVIRSIAKSIPINFELWIKENPANSTRSWRSISDYKQIMNLPNVKMIHPEASNYKLIEECSLVATVAGSSGLEAAVFEKPSIIFSDTLYSQLSCVTRVKEIENLPKIITSSLKQKVNSKEIDKFLQLIEKNSFTFDRLGFITAQTNTFFFGGSLLDTEIDEKIMGKFLQQHSEVIETISREYEKQIMT